MNQKSGRRIFFSVSAIGQVTPSGVFHDVNMPGGETVRFMNRRLYQNALDGADKKLQEILGTPKKAEPSA